MSFVTHNEHKYLEASKLAVEYNIEVMWVNFEYEEIQDDDPETIAKQSCTILLKEKFSIDGPFFLEDAGLFIEALNGFPGPYSSYVYKKIGNKGILKLMENQENRKAYFKSVVAAYFGGDIHLFKGISWGEIAFQTHGEKGFGFDPIFIPEQLAETDEPKTFAEMNTETKNLYSHRQKALRELYSSFSAFAQKPQDGENYG
ncbi:MAG: XTP/dITP diphosphatase [Candidatus Heimdallarchaeaceae archaeon]